MKKTLLVLLAMMIFAGTNDFSHAKGTKPAAKHSIMMKRVVKPLFDLSCGSCTYPYNYTVHLEYNPSTHAILDAVVYDGSGNVIASNAYNTFTAVTQSAPNAYTFTNLYIQVGSIMVNSSGQYFR